LSSLLLLVSLLPQRPCSCCMVSLLL
jgi:hypothetical protein